MAKSSTSGGLTLNGDGRKVGKRHTEEQIAASVEALERKRRVDSVNHLVTPHTPGRYPAGTTSRSS